MLLCKILSLVRILHVEDVLDSLHVHFLSLEQCCAMAIILFTSSVTKLLQTLDFVSHIQIEQRDLETIIKDFSLFP